MARLVETMRGWPRSLDLPQRESFPTPGPECQVKTVPRVTAAVRKTLCRNPGLARQTPPVLSSWKDQELGCAGAERTTSDLTAHLLIC